MFREYKISHKMLVEKEMDNSCHHNCMFASRYIEIIPVLCISCKNKENILIDCWHRIEEMCHVRFTSAHIKVYIGVLLHTYGFLFLTLSV